VRTVWDPTLFTYEVHVKYKHLIKAYKYKWLKNRYSMPKLNKTSLKCIDVNEYVYILMLCHTTGWPPFRGVFRPRQTRQPPRAVDLKGRLLSCQSY